MIYILKESVKSEISEQELKQLQTDKNKKVVLVEETNGSKVYKVLQRLQENA